MCVLCGVGCVMVTMIVVIQLMRINCFVVQYRVVQVNLDVRIISVYLIRGIVTAIGIVVQVKMNQVIFVVPAIILVPRNSLNATRADVLIEILFVMVIEIGKKKIEIFKNFFTILIFFFNYKVLTIVTKMMKDIIV